MSHFPTLIADLALILICAGVMTLIFKKLKQPLVLGYIVAGFLASPHLSCTPSVIDTANIKTWADIGVIFLLFALGLEFSFKKILKVGGTAIIAASTIMVCMILLGIGIGVSFGWHRMDALFLGGMIAMSSTTIIYKAFDDLGVRKKQFAGLVLSILILEDVLAIVLMVMLSTVAVKNNFEGAEMFESIAKLFFFIILWFTVGIFLIPGILKRVRKLMSDETLLIVSLALCLGMVVLAAHFGFSPAFGAFIMGTILAETIEVESIIRIVSPVKDLFGAIFFVSVGMMVDPVMIAQYAVPIVVITFAVILGQSIFGTLGVLLSGKPLKTAMQCGFSLTQIGEFAFIIASMGIALGVTSDFLYPIVVSVSVITTFLTPYMIRLSEPAYRYVDRRLPESWHNVLMRYSTNSQTVVNHSNLWHKLLIALTRITVVYSVVSLAIILLSFRWVVPFFKHLLPDFWASLISAIFIIVCISPFLRAIMVKKNHSVEFTELWKESRANWGPLASTIVLRAVIAIFFVMFVIIKLFELSSGLVAGIALFVILLMVFSKKLKKQSILIERKFFQNLRSREMHAEYMGEVRPKYAGCLLTMDLHLADYQIPGESFWGGKMLKELDLGKRFGVHVVSILRGKRRINIPDGNARLFPMDKIQVIGTDDQLNLFAQEMQSGVVLDVDVYEKKEIILRQFLIDPDSIFLGKTLKDSGIRDKYRCLIAGIERGDDFLLVYNANTIFQKGDVVWVVGESVDVLRLADLKATLNEVCR